MRVLVLKWGCKVTCCSSTASELLSTEEDIMINSDCLEQSKDVNGNSVPLSAEACILIIPCSFECSSERKEERSEDVSVPSAPLSGDRCHGQF